MSNAELWDLDTSGGIMEVNNFFKTGKSEHFKFVVKNAVIFQLPCKSESQNCVDRIVTACSIMKH